MNEQLKGLLAQVSDGSLDITQAQQQIESLYFTDLGHTVLDMDRERRTGHGEVVYCAGKSVSQIHDILSHLDTSGINVLATRLDEVIWQQLAPSFPHAAYDASSRLCSLIHTQPRRCTKGYIAVVSAGTSDASVAEEAAGTIEFYGHEVRRFNDVGVAGIHRLFRHLEEIRGARVVITVAGMEGALASVVGGLVDAPVIAVPTSVGYGANFHGVSALLSMLNSCSSGISVVNIDNGFGAGYLAVMMNDL
ncbi:MAG: nickel pincer cofactor biosynthesis protein LarB [Spirochaetia bacterium]|nr:nickel pincer cofactor biosynthesis protein LarB [Spirochaetia bacterium]MCF7940775.1 nickel pincer cofactor biosynthesis protein LarB [Spirochaetia bacterium]